MTAIIMFFLILISEIVTKTESRFKEAYIALLAWPELGSWLSFLIFHYIEDGYMGSFLFAGIAMVVYVLLNLLHACIHPRKMVPHAL